MPAWNLGAGVAYNLSNNLVANLNTNWYSIDPSEFRDAEKMKGGGTLHANLIWSPYKKVNVGIEYMTLKRVNGDDSSGTGSRLQMMLKYLF
jgi:opacity protein-like surface antigen